VRMMQQGSGNSALIVWHHALKPAEKKLSGRSSNSEKKLRICWRAHTQAWEGGYIPKHKSISEDSQIFAVFATGYSYRGCEEIELGGNTIAARVEAMPMTIDRQTCVLSLLHLDN
jgi:hypothetical protein